MQVSTVSQCPVDTSSGDLGGPQPRPSTPDTGAGTSAPGDVKGPCPDHGYTCSNCLDGWFCPPVQTPVSPAPCGYGWPCYHCESGWFCIPPPENTVTSTFFASPPTLSIVNPTSLSATKGYLYAGCYADEPTRVLTKAEILDMRGGMTNEQCVAFCQKEGLTLAGTEDGSQCFCGDVLLGSVSLPPGHCNVTCTGDVTNSTICGGSWALSVWSPDGAVRQEPNPAPLSNIVGHYASAGERNWPASMKTSMISLIPSPTAFGLGGLEEAQSSGLRSEPGAFTASQMAPASSVMQSISSTPNTVFPSAASDLTYGTSTSKDLRPEKSDLSLGTGHLGLFNHSSRQRTQRCSGRARCRA